MTTEKEDALLVPLAAFDGTTLQILAEGERISTIDVRTGIRGTRTVEVLDGLDEQDRVVLPFREDLFEGSRVRPIGEGDR